MRVAKNMQTQERSKRNLAPLFVILGALCWGTYGSFVTKISAWGLGQRSGIHSFSIHRPAHVPFPSMQGSRQIENPKEGHAPLPCKWNCQHCLLYILLYRVCHSLHKDCHQL